MTADVPLALVAPAASRRSRAPAARDSAGPDGDHAQ